MFSHKLAVFAKQANTIRSLSTRIASETSKQRCKLLIVGGGAGGCTMAAKFAKRLNAKDMIIVEPAEYHYYQPMFTMIGAGIQTLADSRKLMAQVLPKDVTWIQDSVVDFHPEENSVQLAKGNLIEYDFIVIATGLELNFEKIPGLVDGLQMKDSGLCSNYSPMHVNKTFECMRKFRSGNAIFTFPNSPVKCPGAPQKAAYIAEDYFRKHNKREDVKVIYNTALPVIFGVKKYADALWTVCKDRDIDVNVLTNLVRIEPLEKVATFENLQEPNEKFHVSYEMLHVTPPMSTSSALRNCKRLVNNAGFVDVDRDTLQSVRFDNVFAIGDCSSSPNSKTAAAVAAQSSVVEANLSAVMEGRVLESVYNGYASCPLVTSYNRCILAEFDYDLQPLETFPFNQARERRSMYHLKKDVIPSVYWMMLRGRWSGPRTMRKVAHLGTV